jgi:hypothetical protein
MAAADGRGKELHGLLGELLAPGDALRRSQRPRGAVMVFALLGVQPRPLGLVAGLEEGFVGTGSHRHRCYAHERQWRVT